MYETNVNNNKGQKITPMIIIQIAPLHKLFYL